MTSITLTEQISVITYSAIPADNESSLIFQIFEKAAERGIVIDMISRVPSSTDKTALGFTLGDDNIPEFLKISSSLPSGMPIVSSGNVKFVIKSEEMINGTGFAKRVFEALCKSNANPVLVTTALDEISVVVRESDSAEFERKLHELF